MVQGIPLDDAKVISGWDAARQEIPRPVGSCRYRRDDVRDLNMRARAVRQAAGELGEDYRVQTERGERVLLRATGRIFSGTARVGREERHARR
jgi:hypothetical protein